MLTYLSEKKCERCKHQGEIINFYMRLPCLQGEDPFGLGMASFD